MSIDQLVVQFGYVAVFLLVAAESMGIPVPGELTLLAAAVYAGVGRLEIHWVIGVAAAGTIVGGSLGYLIGRTAGRPLLLRYGRYVFLDEKRVHRTEEFFARYGDKAVFFARFIAVLRTFCCLLAGINRMSVPRFSLFNAAGGIVWAVLYGILAFEFGRAVFDRVAQFVGVGGLVIALVAVIVLIFFRDRARELIRRHTSA